MHARSKLNTQILSKDPTRNLVRFPEFEAAHAGSHAAFMTKHLPHASVERDQPDETWIQLEDGIIVGHFSLWYCETPEVKGKSVGFIGHYYAKNRRFAESLLASATSLLKRYGCQLAVGPVDGNTWRRYRLVCGTTGVKSFLMEPENPMEYPGHFIDGGFKTIATYSSSVLEVKRNFLEDGKRPRTADGQLASVSIRSIDMNRFEQELHNIYGIACDAFADAFLYSEISELEFVTRYKQLRTIAKIQDDCPRLSANWIWPPWSPAGLPCCSGRPPRRVPRRACF